MTSDPERLLAMPQIVTRHEITARNTIIYALGVGADELDFTYEEELKPLPSIATVMAYPGETFVTEIWRMGEGRAVFRSSVSERDAVVLNNGYVEFA